ncbi:MULTISPECIES: hypothetical protein [unclassified Mesorhizobium]|uniref:hypothetical protein n=1 Tax=unclassified Mesorhizobium TaxID=325217 RepID=UPI00333864EC
MLDTKSTIRHALEQTGLGPTRIDDVLGGAQIYGPTGIMDSLEFVHFLSSLSEQIRVDVFDLLGELDIATSTIFRNIDELSLFVEAKVATAVELTGQ